MDSSRPHNVADTDGRKYLLGIVLLLLGFGGHLLSARSIGGSAHAYGDHTKGFVILTVASAIILLPLGMKLWRGRPDTTVFAIGATQFVLGLIIYVLTITRVVI